MGSPNFGNPMNSLNTWSNPPGGVMGGGGSNQWMNFPALPNFSATPTPFTGSSTAAGGKGSFFTGTPGGKQDMGGNIFTAPTFDPQFTGQFYQMIQALMGGAGGGLQNNLLSFLSGEASSIPGASDLTGMAHTGDPISALPEWQAMIDAQQRNIGENAANLKEQFAFAGDLSSSPMATGMSDFFTQTTKDQDALLAQLEQQAMESAMQRKLGADTTLTGMAGSETQFLDSLFSGSATASPGLFNKAKTGGLSGLLGGIGSLLSGGASFVNANPLGIFGA